MSYDVIINDIEPEQWGRCAGDFADYSIYQSWAYQQVRGQMDGQAVSRILIKNEAGRVAIMCQVRIKHFKPLGLRIGYVQSGPLVCRKDGVLSCSSEALQILRESYLGKRVNILRIVPNLCDDDRGREFARMLESAGFEYVTSVSPYQTMMLAVDDGEPAIRSRLHRSWRRGLLKAERNNIEVREGPDLEYFDVLERLYEPAKMRKGFKGLDSQVFIKTQQLLSPRDKMNIIVAYYDSEPVTAHASSHLGNIAGGILATSSEKGLACGASYLVWWKTFLAANKAGMKSYDLGGIDLKNNPKVYQFKQRMGGQQCSYIGTYEVCSSLPIKIAWRASEKVYNLINK